MAFCAKCGVQLKDASGFCPACGAPAGQSTSQSAGSAAAPTPAALQRAKLEAELKASSLSALDAVKILVKDPVGGLAKSFATLDAARAKQVGVIFGVVYAIASTITAAVLFRELAGFFYMLMGGGLNPYMGAVPSIPFSAVVKIFFLSLMPFVGLTAAQALVRLIFKATGDLSSDMYVAGASLLPASACMLASCILGYIDLRLIIVLYIFALSYSILMLHAGSSQIAKIAEPKAALTVPLMQIVSGVLIYVTLKIIS